MEKQEHKFGIAAGSKKLVVGSKVGTKAKGSSGLQGKIEDVLTREVSQTALPIIFGGFENTIIHHEDFGRVIIICVGG